MPGSEIVIESPGQGASVATSFTVRGTAPDVAAKLNVCLISKDEKKRIKGSVSGPAANSGGGRPLWSATFTKVPEGEYSLVAAIETRIDLQVASSTATPEGFPGAIAIAILSPSAGATIGNPITVSGSVNPPSCSVTVTITVGGNDYNGTVTGPDSNGNWSATFPTIPSGSATIGATAKKNGNSSTATEGVTVK